MLIFEYAVIFNPNNTDLDRKDWETSKLLVDVTRVLVADGVQAQTLAARAIPEEYLDRLDEVEIAVRPF